MKNKKYLMVLGLSLILATSTVVTGCNMLTGNTTTEKTAEVSDETTETDGEDAIVATNMSLSDAFTDRDLTQDYDDSEAIHITLSGTTVTSDSKEGIEVSGSTITITTEGVYVFSGNLTDGQIIVDADKDNDKVQIVLNGAYINTDSSSVIYVKSADKVFVTTAEGTDNTLVATGESVTDDDTSVDGTIFSKDDLVLNGLGTLNVESTYGNCVVSKDDLKITGGTINLTTPQKHGLESNDDLLIADGTITISDSKEGMEGGDVVIYGGTIDIQASDDGINALNSLTINGGVINIDADGDGLDSNGSFTVNGGETYVSGPTNDGNGAIDSGEGYEVVVNGGILIAAGSSGMVEGFSSESTQGAILNTYSSAQTGEVKITDADGNVLASYTPSKQYSAVNITAPGIEEGGTYTLIAGSESTEITMESITYGQGMGGFGGSFGGNGGQMPDGEMPDFENGERPELPDGEMPNFENGEKPERP